MTVIGIVGQIKSGKSTVSRIMGVCGGRLFDADCEVHKLYKHDPYVKEQVFSVAPDCIVDNKISLQKIRDMIICDPRILHKLEKIFFPIIKKKIEDFLQLNSGDFCVLDIPLLFEMNLQHLVDHVVCISARKKIVSCRMRKNKKNEKLMKILSNRQIEIIKKKYLSDFFIFNNSSIKELSYSVLSFLYEIGILNTGFFRIKS